MATKTNSKQKSKGTKPQKTAPQVATRSKDPAKKLSALDAAARVLGESKEPMNCPQMIETMAAKGYWKSPAGKTPASTLYAALKREITIKKKEARFKQSGPGNFTLA
jgi:HB1, ASXL, restriction endonuclease HTH domain